MKVLFTNRYTHLDSIIESLSDKASFFVLQNKKRHYKDLRGVRHVPVKHATFGMSLIINEVFKLQTTIPVAVKGFKRIANNIKPDMIVVFDFTHFIFLQSLSYLKLNRSVKIILVSETKAFPKNIFSRIIFKVFLKLLNKNISKIEKILVFSEQGKSWFEQNVNSVPIDLIFLPINYDKFGPPSTKKYLLGGTLNVIMNARFVSYKRHEDLFKAVNVIKKEGLTVKITCISRSSQGKEKIINLAHKLGVASEVTFLPPLNASSLSQIYQNHDALVLPSDNEAIGMVVPEAMACGLVTVTSDSVGANVYVEEGETGFIFETRNVLDLVNVLRPLFNEPLLVRMGQNSYQRIKTLYSFENITRQFHRELNLGSYE